MKTIALTFLLLTSTFPQGMYLPNQNAFGGGIFYARYTSTSDYILGFSGTYSYKGVVEVFYNRSSVLTTQEIRNYHNQYILRGYLFNGNRFFLSGAVGYQDYYAEAEIWNDFILVGLDDGFLYEGGVHLATTDQESKKIVVSLFYRLFESTERIQTGGINSSSTIMTKSKLSSTFTFDAALIYYLSQIGLAIGPRLVLENDFAFASVGFNFSVMLIH